MSTRHWRAYQPYDEADWYDASKERSSDLLKRTKRVEAVKSPDGNWRPQAPIPERTELYTIHGPAFVKWRTDPTEAAPRPTQVLGARLSDDRRCMIRSTMELGPQRRSEDDSGWICGRLEILEDDVVFLDEAAPPLPDFPRENGSLESDLAHDEEFRSSALEEAFALSAHQVLAHENIYRQETGDLDRDWPVTGGPHGFMAVVDGRNNSYLDYKMWMVHDAAKLDPAIYQDGATRMWAILNRLGWRGEKLDETLARDKLALVMSLQHQADRLLRLEQETYGSSGRKTSLWDRERDWLRTQVRHYPRLDRPAHLPDDEALELACDPAALLYRGSRLMLRRGEQRVGAIPGAIDFIAGKAEVVLGKERCRNLVADATDAGKKGHSDRFFDIKLRLFFNRRQT